MRSYRLALLAALALALVAVPASPASAADPWSLTGSIDGSSPVGHTATLLQDGRVLLAGGQSPNPMARARLYDPELGAWSDTGTMGTGRTLHTATALPDGRVLVAGGYGAGLLASAEIYDPATGGWSPTAAMSSARYEHTATLVGGGKVLVTGGYNGAAALASAELYDPATGAWSPAGDLATARHTHTATRLPDGDVLVAGGDDGGNTVASAERYDAATNAWSPAGTMTSPRESHAAAALLDGRILVVGGWSGSFNRVTFAELYDPVVGTWSAIAPMHVGRGGLSATTLPDGRVLVAGGDDMGTAEVLDPATGSWENAGRMATPRFRHTATPLRDGSVLVAGGTMLNATERFALSATFAATPLHFGDRRSGAGATRAWVLVRNLGSLPIRITEATLGGAHASDFTIADDACNGRALAPDASCRIGIDFAPRADGNRGADLTLKAATGETEVAPLTGTGVPAAPATPQRTATASCVHAPRKARVKLRGARCRFSLVGVTGWTTVKAELRRGGKVRAAGRVLGWRGGGSLTLAARKRLGRGAYTLVLRPAGRTPVRLRVTLP
jgi:hypothetical protein